MTLSFDFSLIYFSFHPHRRQDQQASCTGKLQQTTGLIQFCIEALKETDSAAFLQVLKFNCAWLLCICFSGVSLCRNVSRNPTLTVTTSNERSRFCDPCHRHRSAFGLEWKFGPHESAETISKYGGIFSFASQPPSATEWKRPIMMVPPCKPFLSNLSYRTYLFIH